MKDRLTHWPSTVPGLAVLAVIAVLVFVRPDLGDKPEVLISVAAGLLALLMKGRNSGE